MIHTHTLTKRTTLLHRPYPGIRFHLLSGRERFPIRHHHHTTVCQCEKKGDPACVAQDLEGKDLGSEDLVGKDLVGQSGTQYTIERQLQRPRNHGLYFASYVSCLGRDQ
jgi:hypothetical protein